MFSSSINVFQMLPERRTYICRNACISPETRTEFGWKTMSKKEQKNVHFEQLHRPLELELTLIFRIWFRIDIPKWIQSTDGTVRVFYQQKQKQTNKSTIRGWVLFVRPLIVFWFVLRKMQWSRWSPSYLTTEKNQHSNYRMLFVRCLY